MPGFRYKDLMINVMPEGQGEAAAAGANAIRPCIQNISCPGGSVICTAICSFNLSHMCITQCSFLQTVICTAFCSHCSIVYSGGCTGGCTGIPSICTGGSIITLTPVMDDPMMAQTQNLGVLKDQLRQALTDIEQHEQAQARATEPQSVEEIESLQEKLRGALEDLETRKGQMGGKKTK